MKRQRSRGPFTVAVLGFGSIGRRHAANAARLGARVIVAARSPAKVAAEVARLGYRNAHNIADAFELADAVVVATPTHVHMSAALAAAKARKAIFIEKPLSVDRKHVDELQAAARSLVVEVGCQLRAHPALQMLERRLASGQDGPVLAFRGCVGHRLDEWRPGTDYRRSYSADARRGGGALMDLIHEIDLVQWLLGPVVSVAARLSRVSDLELRAEDLANLLLECKSGICGSLQLDMLSPVYRRSFEVVCARAQYDWDYVAATLTRRSVSSTRILWRAPESFVRNDLYLSHMRHFISRACGSRAAPICSLADGVGALDVALAARRAARSRKWSRVRQSNS